MRILFTLFILTGFTFWAQETIHVQFKWLSPRKANFQGLDFEVPSFEQMTMNGMAPNYVWQKKLKNGNFKVECESIDYSPLSTNEMQFLKQTHQLPTENGVVFQSSVNRSKNEYFANVSVFPFLYLNGSYFRLESFKITLSPSVSPLNSAHEKDFVANSVLGNGTWFKIRLKKDGVYKIDYAFLASCGINMQNLNSNSIHIFGNGEGKLPELNSVFRSDDLQNNALYMVDGNDAVFNTSDYLLFHAWGPDRKYFKPSTSKWISDKHIYDDYSYYFIHISSSIPPNRILDDNSVVAPSTQTINKSDFHTVYEQDLSNLVKAGQRWYGDLFDAELSKNYSFYIPNVITSSPAKIDVSFATNATNGSGSFYKVTCNGNPLLNASLPSTSYDWVRSEYLLNWTNPTSNLNLNLQLNRTSAAIKAYLDRIEINAQRDLVMYGNQMYFSDYSSVAPGVVGTFEMANMNANYTVWDVTHRQMPKKMNGVLSGTTFSFVSNLDSLKTYVTFHNNAGFLEPELMGRINNQDLHAQAQADLLIVTPSVFLAQANRLADLHRSEGQAVNVAVLTDIYNEFSSGAVDPTAIRMYAKMFYERSIQNGSLKPSSLLLFGDGTFDPKNRVANNNNFIPTYQFLSSENHISALVSDDYFGMLDDNESMAPNDMVDIGVGRLLISDQTMAKQQVDKIEHYMKNGSNLYVQPSNSLMSNASKQSTFGDWRLKAVQVADDEEGGYFIVQDAEPQCAIIDQANYSMNIDKLYLDAYTQVSQAGGQRYPDVFNAITDRVESGSLIINYIGHGGEVGVASERVVTIPQIESWNNIHCMNLFVSATCEFTKYDDPDRVSAGELVSLNPQGGAIALMTTTRPVFFGVNTVIGQQFFTHVFDRDAQFRPSTFGEIIRLTKNAAGGIDNKRAFTLIGDPALKIALPNYKVVTDSINGLSPNTVLDTLNALSKVSVKGHVEDYFGNVLTGFNGYLEPSIFDKPKTFQTLGQDPDSPILDFNLQKNNLFKGNVSVTNGQFSFDFIVPKDINYSIGKGKISYYAYSANADAAGADSNVFIGGFNPNGIVDDQGPEISLFMNDRSFVNKGLTDEKPVFLADLFDENGINTVGNGIGHDLTAVLDQNSANPIILNEYYRTDLDTYQSGKLSYQMPELSEGVHTITLTAWDVNNNSSSASIEFLVAKNQALKLDHVLNYPNPFTTSTDFYFEHNQMSSVLDVQIDVLTVSGKLVKTIQNTIQTSGFRSEGIHWDGRDEFGDRLAKGVYIYKLSVRSEDGKVVDKLEKLVIL